MREREQDDAADEEQRLARQLGDPVCHQRLQHGEVGGEAARELAGAALGEEAGRETHEVREHVLAQLRDHALRRAGEQVHLDEVHHALQREGEHERTMAMRSSGARSCCWNAASSSCARPREGEPHRRGDDQADRARSPVGRRRGGRGRQERRERRRGRR